MGFDLVAFLDADNWYGKNHIENAVDLYCKSDADVIFARRRIIFPDGDELKGGDPQDAKQTHVDTNCFVISKQSAFVVSAWAMWPKEFGTGEDRALWAVVKHARIKTAYLTDPTVFYLTNWGLHYRVAGKTPVAPIRKPIRKSGLHFEPIRFQQATGCNIPFRRSPEASDPKFEMSKDPTVCLVAVVDSNFSELNAVEKLNALLIHRPNTQLILVGKEKAFDGKDFERTTYLSIPNHLCFETSAMGIASVLAFHNGADLVVVTPPSKECLSVDELASLIERFKTTKADLLIDQRAAKNLNDEKTVRNDSYKGVRAIAISSIASSLGFLFAQLPIELAIDDIIPIYLTIAMARTKNVSLINYKNSIKSSILKCNPEVFNEKNTALIQSIFQRTGVTIKKFY